MRFRAFMFNPGVFDNVRVSHVQCFPVFAVFAVLRFRVFALSCSILAFSITFVFKELLGTCSIPAFSRLRVLPAATPRPGHRFRAHSSSDLHLFFFQPKNVRSRSHILPLKDFRSSSICFQPQNLRSRSHILPLKD